MLSSCIKNGDSFENDKNIVKESNYLPGGRSIHFEQPFAQELFKNMLINESIRFETKILLDKEWVIWNESDSDKVATIKKFVSKKSRDQIIKEFEESTSNKSKQSDAYGAAVFKH